MSTVKTHQREINNLGTSHFYEDQMTVTRFSTENPASC